MQKDPDINPEEQVLFEPDLDYFRVFYSPSLPMIGVSGPNTHRKIKNI